MPTPLARGARALLAVARAAPSTEVSPCDTGGPLGYAAKNLGVRSIFSLQKDEVWVSLSLVARRPRAEHTQDQFSKFSSTGQDRCSLWGSSFC